MAEINLGHVVGPAGPGVPTGGATGKVLVKKSSADYDTEWGDAGTSDALPLAGGTMSGAINMDGNKVSNLPTPTAGGDAVPKGYTDNADALSAKASEIGIVITGARPSMVVSAGQYVIVRNSTITGITDGLYTAAQAIPANTEIDATYLSAKIAEGGLNDLNNKRRLLWSQSGLSWGEDDINLSDGNYSRLEVVFKPTNGAADPSISQFFNANCNISLTFCTVLDNANDTFIMSRQIRFNTKISFTPALGKIARWSGTIEPGATFFMYPVAIYGIYD